MATKKCDKVLVIGGSGFVGSHLISLFNNESISNLDKNKSPFYNDITTLGDIRKPNDIKLNKNIDTVVLLAAEHKDNVKPVDLYYDVNVQGTKNVLNKMDEYGIKNLVFTSSVAVYGLNKENPDENHPVDPFNHYGKSKYSAEIVIKKWFDKDPKTKSVLIIRPTVIFGERNRGNVFNLLKQINSKKFIMIGDGRNKKSMAYVGNITAYIKDYVDDKTKKGFHVFNYSDKPDFDMVDLVRLVEKHLKIKTLGFKIPFFLGFTIGLFFDALAIITSKKLLISSVRVKKFCAKTQFNSDKLMQTFTPPYTIHDALKRTLEFEFIEEKKDEIEFFTE